MKILHLSDLHYHRSNNDNRKVNKTLKTVKDKYPDHFIVVTGDISDDGHPKQFKNAFQALKAFKDRVFIVPGNHDFGALGNIYSRERALRFDEMLSGPLEQGGTFSFDNHPVVNTVEKDGDRVMFIGLDSNLETNHIFDFACGEVGDTQRSVLGKILDDHSTRDYTKILFFHHHPFIHNNPFMEMKDAERLARVIYQKVDIMMFGHKHEVMHRTNTWGVKHILASDNSPGKSKAGELTINQGNVTFQYVDI